MFQRKTEEIFNEIAKCLGIADEILIVGYDGSIANHDRSLHRG